MSPSQPRPCVYLGPDVEEPEPEPEPKSIQGQGVAGSIVLHEDPATHSSWVDFGDGTWAPVWKYRGRRWYHDRCWTVRWLDNLVGLA